MTGGTIQSCDYSLLNIVLLAGSVIAFTDIVAALYNSIDAAYTDFYHLSGKEDDAQQKGFKELGLLAEILKRVFTGEYGILDALQGDNVQWNLSILFVMLIFSQTIPLIVVASEKTQRVMLHSDRRLAIWELIDLIRQCLTPTALLFIATFCYEAVHSLESGETAAEIVHDTANSTMPATYPLTRKNYDLLRAIADLYKDLLSTIVTATELDHLRIAIILMISELFSAPIISLLRNFIFPDSTTATEEITLLLRRTPDLSDSKFYTFVPNLYHGRTTPRSRSEQHRATANNTTFDLLGIPHGRGEGLIETDSVARTSDERIQASRQSSGHVSSRDNNADEDEFRTALSELPGVVGPSTDAAIPGKSTSQSQSRTGRQTETPLPSPPRTHRKYSI